MRRAPRLLPVHRHTSGHQGQVQDHQQGLLLQVQRQDSEADAGTCPGELCQETIIPKVRGRGIIIFIITNTQSSDMFALSTAAAAILAPSQLSQFYPE